MGNSFGAGLVNEVGSIRFVFGVVEGLSGTKAKVGCPAALVGSSDCFRLGTVVGMKLPGASLSTYVGMLG